MAVKVVDASALSALLFGEPEGEAVALSLEEGRLVAPALLDFELANVCVMKCRRHPAQRQALIEAFGYRTRLSIEVLTIDHDAARGLAEETGLTAYDASYLWLSRALGAELITLDRRLQAAAIAQG
jgi:predicted nucleic acid-binding protein